LCNKGLTVAEVSPEAAVGGPLGLVQNDDVIAIDVDRHTLDLEVDANVLAARKVKLGTRELKKATGWLAIYQSQVQPMSSGVVLVKDP
jgi:dihydroxy-acid dehydratase